MLRSTDDELSQAIDLIEHDDHAAALPLLARVTSFQPDNALAYELWIQSHIRLERFAKALELVEAGLRRGLPPAPLHALRSEALRLSNRIDEAVDAAKAALAIDPSLSFAVRALALAESARGAHDDALGVYEEALARIDDDEDLHFAFLELAAELGKDELIVEHARRFLRKFGQDADVLGILGDAYLSQRDFRRADRAFRDAASLEPEVVAHHVMILVVMLMREDEAGYNAYVEKLEADDPDLAEAVTQEIALLADQE